MYSYVTQPLCSNISYFIITVYNMSCWNGLEFHSIIHKIYPMHSKHHIVNKETINYAIRISRCLVPHFRCWANNSYFLQWDITGQVEERNKNFSKICWSDERWMDKVQWRRPITNTKKINSKMAFMLNSESIAVETRVSVWTYRSKTPTIDN